MLSVVALLFAALLMPQAHQPLAAVERGPALPPAPSFCAELNGPPLLAISGGEDFMPFDEEQGCSESDVLQPYDVEAPVDAT